MLPNLNLPSGNNIPNVNKVIIYAHKDSKFLGLPTSVFVLPINPENYDRTHKVHLNRSQPLGTAGTTPQYRGTQPETIKLDFTLDNTGTVEGNILNGVPINLQVEFLKKVVLDKDPDTHEPYKLKLIWATLIFDCVLESLDIKYTLFDSFGIPMRAKLSASFVSSKDLEKEKRMPSQNSPDVTHLKNFAEGENLPRLTFEVYGKSDYYLQVAKTNDMTSFRNIKDGSEVIFPSIEKN